ncbi:hypothetical protein IE53DRAFT_391242 [Violaceomyces palustris]|uniref:Uncharacterized protein n=1 Tax=Violaceomyces palustris TaxID=1673888 RepID=A0ACD0NLE0_9BASI|nr:hypothetical protein IE53DRAFT_391242 [Violaceomyces palustris]
MRNRSWRPVPDSNRTDASHGLTAMMRRRHVGSVDPQARGWTEEEEERIMTSKVDLSVIVLMSLATHLPNPFRFFSFPNPNLGLPAPPPNPTHSFPFDMASAEGLPSYPMDDPHSEPALSPWTRAIPNPSFLSPSSNLIDYGLFAAIWEHARLRNASKRKASMRHAVSRRFCNAIFIFTLPKFKGW